MKINTSEFRSRFEHLGEEMLLLSREGNELAAGLHCASQIPQELSIWLLGTSVSALTLHRWLSGLIQTEETDLDDSCWNSSLLERAHLDFKGVQRLVQEGQFEDALSQTKTIKGRLKMLTDDLFPD